MKKNIYEAFTLIELLVVLSIISIFLFLVTPRIISTGKSDKVRNFARRMYNTLEYLNEKAILEKKVFIFSVDLDERRYYFTVSEPDNPEGKVKDRYLVPVSFPPGINLNSVEVIPGGELFEGKADIPFTPNGLLYSFAVKVEESKESFLVIQGSSINSRIELLRVREGKRVDKL